MPYYSQRQINLPMTLTQAQMDRIAAYRAERDAKNAEWMATLTPDQVEVVQSKLDMGSDLEALREFVEDYGFEYLFAGSWEMWGDLNVNYPDRAIQAFVDEFGIDKLGNFSNAYIGRFNGEVDFVTFILDERGVDIPNYVEVDHSSTMDNLLSEGYTELSGYYFLPF